MDINKLNEITSKADPLLDSGINVIKRKPNGEKKVIQCVFTDYKDGGVGPIKEVGEHTSREEMSYSPKAILTVKSTNEIIDKFPLIMVVEAIKKGEAINDDYFEETKNKKE